MANNEGSHRPDENSGDAQISLLGENSPVSPVCYFPHLTAGQLPEHSLPRLDSGQYPGVEVEEGDDGNDGVWIDKIGGLI